MIQATATTYADKVELEQRYARHDTNMRLGGFSEAVWPLIMLADIIEPFVMADLREFVGE